MKSSKPITKHKKFKFLDDRLEIRFARVTPDSRVESTGCRFWGPQAGPRARESLVLLALLVLLVQLALLALLVLLVLLCYNFVFYFVNVV